MGTTRRRRSGSLALGAAAVVLGLPALAPAQLLPRLPIRRERVPHELEPPVYKLYRHQYYGYFPTCWRRFPPGWGCPSPEAPNFEIELGRKPLPTQVEDFDTETGEPRPPGSSSPEIPSLPTDPGTTLPEVPRPERSPFELPDTGRPSPGTNPPADAPRRENQPPTGEIPPPPGETIPAPPATSPNPPAVTPPEAAADVPPIIEPLPPATGSPSAHRAPQRRGLLAGFFGGRGRVRP